MLIHADRLDQRGNTAGTVELNFHDEGALHLYVVTNANARATRYRIPEAGKQELVAFLTGGNVVYRDALDAEIRDGVEELS